METMLPSQRVKHLSRAAFEPRTSWEDPRNQEPRILVVDDDPGMAELIAAMLESDWLNCVVRSSGAQGIQAFADGEVDVIITDLRMGAGDGIALIESIRRTSRVPVIIVTGFASEFADRVRFLENVALIQKPFDRRVLIELVERALESGHRGADWNVVSDMGE